MDYKRKYLKYKTKYVEIKKQLGGKCNDKGCTIVEFKKLLKSYIPEKDKDKYKDNMVAKSKKEGFRYKIINGNFSLRILFDSDVKLSELIFIDYFEDVNINEWLRALLFSKPLVDFQKIINFLYEANLIKIAGNLLTINGFIPHDVADQEFRKIGYDIKHLVKISYNFNQLKAIGYSIPEMRTVGLDVKTLYNDGNYTLDQIKKGSYTNDEIFTFIKQNIKDIKLLTQFLEAGFTLKDIKSQNWEFKEDVFKKAGITVEQLRNEAGYEIQDFKNADYDDIDYKKLGFDIKEVFKASTSIKRIKEFCTYTFDEIKTVYNVQEILGAYKKDELNKIGYTFQKIWDDFEKLGLETIRTMSMYLKLAGYLINEIKTEIENLIKNQSERKYLFTILKDYNIYKILKFIGYTTTDFKNAPFDFEAYYQAGFSLFDFKNAYDESSERNEILNYEKILKERKERKESI